MRWNFQIRHKNQKLSRTLLFYFPTAIAKFRLVCHDEYNLTDKLNLKIILPKKTTE